MLVGLVGGLAVFWHSLTRLRQWDLEESPAAPDPSRGKIVLIAAIVAVVLAFALYNWFSDIGIPPGQQMANTIAWGGGAVVGGIGAYLAGRRLAFGSYRKLGSGEAGQERSLPREDS